jgi:hypothetical protein
VIADFTLKRHPKLYHSVWQSSSSRRTGFNLACEPTTRNVEPRGRRSERTQSGLKQYPRAFTPEPLTERPHATHPPSTTINTNHGPTPSIPVLLFALEKSSATTSSPPTHSPLVKYHATTAPPAPWVTCAYNVSVPATGGSRTWCTNTTLLPPYTPSFGSPDPSFSYAKSNGSYSPNSRRC